MRGKKKKHHTRKDIIKQDEHGSTENCALYNTKQLSVLRYALHNNRTDQMLPDVRVQSVKQLVSSRVTDSRMSHVKVATEATGVTVMTLKFSQVSCM